MAIRNAILYTETIENDMWHATFRREPHDERWKLPSLRVNGFNARGIESMVDLFSEKENTKYNPGLLLNGPIMRLLSDIMNDGIMS